MNNKTTNIIIGIVLSAMVAGFGIYIFSMQGEEDAYNATESTPIAITEVAETTTVEAAPQAAEEETTEQIVEESTVQETDQDKTEKVEAVKVDPNAERKANFHKQMNEIAEIARSHDIIALSKRILEPGTKLYEMMEPQLAQMEAHMSEIPPQMIEMMNKQCDSLGDFFESLNYDELDWQDNGEALVAFPQQEGMGPTNSSAHLYNSNGNWYIRPIMPESTEQMQ